MTSTFTYCQPVQAGTPASSAPLCWEELNFLAAREPPPLHSDLCTHTHTQINNSSCRFLIFECGIVINCTVKRSTFPANMALTRVWKRVWKSSLQMSSVLYSERSLPFDPVTMTTKLNLQFCMHHLCEVPHQDWETQCEYLQRRSNGSKCTAKNRLVYCFDFVWHFKQNTTPGPC